jgi:hypothetical protein
MKQKKKARRVFCAHRGFCLRAMMALEWRKSLRNSIHIKKDNYVLDGDGNFIIKRDVFLLLLLAAAAGCVILWLSFYFDKNVATC